RREPLPEGSFRPSDHSRARGLRPAGAEAVTDLIAEHDTERIAGLVAEAERRFGTFVHEWVNPGADGRDRTGEPLPRALFSEAGRLGLIGFSLPPEVGGQGRVKFEWGIVLEEVSRISRDPALWSLLDV